jgi:hypothetical protein
MAQLDVCVAVVNGRESHLDLAGSVFLLLDLPLGTDQPRKNQTVRGVDIEDAAPHADGSIDASVVDSATGLRFENGLGDVNREQVVLARFDPVELLREHPEGVIKRHRDIDREPDLVGDLLLTHWTRPPHSSAPRPA